MESDLLSRLGNDHDKHRLMVWLVQAPEVREPATMELLADEIGVTSRTLRNWKRDPEFVRLWRAEAYNVIGDPQETQDVLRALKQTAMERDHKQHVAAANAFLKAVGGLTPPDEAQVKQESILEDMSLEQLEELAVGIFGKRLADMGVEVAL